MGCWNNQYVNRMAENMNGIGNDRSELLLVMVNYVQNYAGALKQLL